MKLRPLKQLIASDTAGRWLSTGVDPQFLCGSEGQEALEAGWYRIRIQGELDFGLLEDPALYPDYGDGFGEIDKIPLRALASTSSGIVEGTILLKSKVERLRFDPCHSAQGVSIEEFSMIPVGRLQVLGKLLAWKRGELGSGEWLMRMLNAFGSLIRGGPRRMVDQLYGAYLGAAFQRHQISYTEWLSRYDHIPVYAGAATDPQLLFSILVPTFNTPAQWLLACIDSVLSQQYEHWELCIADDGSTRYETNQVLSDYESRDQRIRVLRRPYNGHMSEATNSALSMATGEFVLLLDHDDCLHPHALSELAAAASCNPHWDLIYTDEDKLDARNRRCEPYFKPDFNLDLLRGQNCITHASAYRSAIVRHLGGCRVGYEGSQDWDLALRFVEYVGPSRIGHVPRVLYHWRMGPESTAANNAAKPYVLAAALRTIGDHLERTCPGAKVAALPGQMGNYRVRHALPHPRPRVSVIIPSRDQPQLLLRCVNSIRDTAPDYELEFIVVDNGSRTEEAANALRLIERVQHARVIRDERPFNYSALNNLAARQATGDVILFANDDLEAISEGWLDELVSHAMRPDVGAVGAKLYYPDGTIQHAGVILGAGGIAAHQYRGAPGSFSGQMNRTLLAQDLSAVTAACLAIRTTVFEAIGGFDEQLAVSFNDVDLCLRLRAAGFLIVWTPFAELFHHESVSREKLCGETEVQRAQDECELMQRRWQEWIDADPAYNPNLALDPPWFELAVPPRRRPLRGSLHPTAGLSQAQ